MRINRVTGGQDAQENRSALPTEPYALQELFIIVSVVSLSDTGTPPLPNTIIYTLTDFFYLSCLRVYNKEY